MWYVSAHVERVYAVQTATDQGRWFKVSWRRGLAVAWLVLLALVVPGVAVVLSRILEDLDG